MELRSAKHYHRVYHPYATRAPKGWWGSGGGAIGRTPRNRISGQLRSCLPAMVAEPRGRESLKNSHRTYAHTVFSRGMYFFPPKNPISIVRRASFLFREPKTRMWAGLFRRCRRRHRRPWASRDSHTGARGFWEPCAYATDVFVPGRVRRRRALSVNVPLLFCAIFYTSIIIIIRYFSSPASRVG